VRPEPTRGGEGWSWRKEVIKQDIIHLMGGLCPGEGGEAGWRVAEGKSLSRPKRLWRGPLEEGRPVFSFRSLNGLEVPRFRGFRGFLQGGRVVLPCCSGGLMELSTEDSKVR